jgi:hypothetical protein
MAIPLFLGLSLVQAASTAQKRARAFAGLPVSTVTFLDGDSAYGDQVR